MAEYRESLPADSSKSTHPKMEFIVSRVRHYFLNIWFKIWANDSKPFSSYDEMCNFQITEP
jgi:hypothetical protein